MEAIKYNSKYKVVDGGGNGFKIAFEHDFFDDGFPEFSLSISEEGLFASVKVFKDDDVSIHKRKCINFRKGMMSLQDLKELIERVERRIQINNYRSRFSNFLTN